MLISDMGIRGQESSGRKGQSHRMRSESGKLDEMRMAELVGFTSKSMRTKRPVPFGCSIIDSKTGEVLLKALNAVAGEFDPSAHAEVRAIRKSAKKLKNISLKGFTLYTTCEPCPMCMSAALWAGVDRVVYGATIEDASRHCRQIHIHGQEVVDRSDMKCKVEGPVLQEQCYSLFTHPQMLKAFETWSSRKG